MGPSGSLRTVEAKPFTAALFVRSPCPPLPCAHDESSDDELHKNHLTTANAARLTASPVLLLVFLPLLFLE